MVSFVGYFLEGHLLLAKDKIFGIDLSACSVKSLPLTAPAFNKRCFSMDAAFLERAQEARWAALTTDQILNNIFP